MATTPAQPHDALIKRFQFLNLVQQVAKRDLDAVVEQVGLETVQLQQQYDRPQQFHRQQRNFDQHMLSSSNGVGVNHFQQIFPLSSHHHHQQPSYADGKTGGAKQQRHGQHHTTPRKERRNKVAAKMMLLPMMTSADDNEGGGAASSHYVAPPPQHQHFGFQPAATGPSSPQPPASHDTTKAEIPPGELPRVIDEVIKQLRRGQAPTTTATTTHPHKTQQQKTSTHVKFMKSEEEAEEAEHHVPQSKTAKQDNAKNKDDVKLDAYIQKLEETEAKIEEQAERLKELFVRATEDQTHQEGGKNLRDNEVHPAGQEEHGFETDMQPVCSTGVQVEEPSGNQHSTGHHQKKKEFKPQQLDLGAQKKEGISMEKQHQQKNKKSNHGNSHAVEMNAKKKKEEGVTLRSGRPDAESIDRNNSPSISSEMLSRELDKLTAELNELDEVNERIEHQFNSSNYLSVAKVRQEEYGVETDMQPVCSTGVQVEEPSGNQHSTGATSTMAATTTQRKRKQDRKGGELPLEMVESIRQHRRQTHEHFSSVSQVWNTSSISSVVFAERLADELLKDFVNEGLDEVSGILDEYVEGLVDYELR